MKKSWKRSLSLLVAAVMVLAMLPASLSTAGAVAVCDHDHSTMTALSGEVSATSLTAGNYYLSGDVTLSGTVALTSGTLHLCLNGNTLSTSAKAFNVTGATLKLCDCAGGGILQGTSGEAVYLNANATFDMYGGTITGFAVSAGAGSAVRCEQATSTFNMYGGIISGNTCKAGFSPVDINRGTFNLYGGTINDSVGIGRHASIKSYLNITGDVGTVNLGALDIKANGVFFLGNLTSESANITSATKLVATGTSVVETDNGDGTYTYSYQAPYIAKVGNTTYTDLVSAFNAANGEMVVLHDNATLSAVYNVTGTLNLDLNGYTITTTSGAFKTQDCTLNLYDNSANKTGKIYGDITVNANCIEIKRNSSVNMYGGTITNYKSNYGAVRLDENATAVFNMYGGSITGNKQNSVSYPGGGVSVRRGTFNMYGGTVSGNTGNDIAVISSGSNVGVLNIKGACNLGVVTMTAPGEISLDATGTVTSSTDLNALDTTSTMIESVSGGVYTYTPVIAHAMQNVRLQDLIKIGYYFTVNTDADTVGALLWTKEAYEAETDFTANNEDAQCIVTFDGTYHIVETDGVLAQNLDQVYVMIPYAKVGDNYIYGAAKEYSVLDYAKTVYVDKAEDAEYADARTLIIDLLNYGTAARSFFYTRAGKTDTVAPFNSILSDTDKVVNWNESMRETYGTGTTDGTLNIVRYGRSAELLEAIQLNVFYTGDSFSAAKYWLDAAEKHDALVSDATVSGQAMTKVSIPEIYAFNIYDDYSVQPVEGNAVGNTTVTSVAAYLTRLLDMYAGSADATDVACVALAKAMMVYGYDADAIFNQ